jgi:predicted nuclease with TOPRIM domain
MKKDLNEAQIEYDDAVDAANDAEAEYEDAMSEFDMLSRKIAELEEDLHQVLLDVGKYAQQQAVTKLECSRAYDRLQALEKNKQ